MKLDKFRKEIYKMNLNMEIYWDVDWDGEVVVNEKRTRDIFESKLKKIMDIAKLTHKTSKTEVKKK